MRHRPGQPERFDSLVGNTFLGLPELAHRGLQKRHGFPVAEHPDAAATSAAFVVRRQSGSLIC